MRVSRLILLLQATMERETRLPTLGPTIILKIGLQILNIATSIRQHLKWKRDTFHEHFGSDPIVLADMWHNLLSTDIPSAIVFSKDRTYQRIKQNFHCPLFSLVLPEKCKIHINSSSNMWEVFKGRTLAEMD